MTHPRSVPPRFASFASPPSPPPSYTLVTNGSSHFHKTEHSQITQLVDRLMPSASPRRQPPYGTRRPQPLAGSGRAWFVNSIAGLEMTMLFIDRFRMFSILPFTLDVRPPLLDQFPSSSPSRSTSGTSVTSQPFIHVIFDFGHR